MEVSSTGLQRTLFRISFEICSFQFKWDEVDLNNDDQLKELYQLLNENYVEDDDKMFRFDYAPEFLKWALMPPGWLPSWHVGVRVEKSNKLGE